jgi:phosphoribosylformylglycinamidine synthase
MLEGVYENIDQDIFKSNNQPDPILYIDDISQYNNQEGLSLSEVEIAYLQSVSKSINRKLTDSEVFGFSQVNSEHCRHKIFNGTFEIDGEQMPNSLFQLIKKTSKENPNSILSAYKDNVAFIQGPLIEQFAPKEADSSSLYHTKNIESIISLKAETHNFPTTVEAFNGAATGSGGEIRDRMAGGKAAIPLAGTAVYMAPYSRLEKDRVWENIPERAWLYQTPIDILIKASNGASDFGNKFGQPLIAGSILTFEHTENNKTIGYDKVIMQAGGIGFATKKDTLKALPKAGDKIVVMGGDNYRIGMGGAAVSSADTGAMDNIIALNAIQRSNPEMQKRVANVIRALSEQDLNPIVSIHDHGAGGHLNCLSELIEDTGGIIKIDKLPIGDPSLSYKEIMGNESQERMGLIVHADDLPKLIEIAKRERAPLYEVGTVTEDQLFQVISDITNEKPIDLSLFNLFGNTPITYLKGKSEKPNYREINYDSSKIYEYTTALLQLEAVASKDWLTNKVDRCVTGRVAKQQTCGSLQLPLNNVGVMALDYHGKEGIATSIGHAPIASLIDEQAGARLAITESLTNIIWAPLQNGLKAVSLSANWMWSAKNEIENARLYTAVKAVSDFAIDLGINIPTGKDSLSMNQKYPNKDVMAPGTVIISATGHCNDITKVVEPAFQAISESKIYYINLGKDSYKLGGSSFAQIRNAIGNEIPDIHDTQYVKNVFNSMQELIKTNQIIAGHDVASGGLITTLLEMCFPNTQIGAQINLSELGEKETVKVLFAENSGLVFQAKESIEKDLQKANINFICIGNVTQNEVLNINNQGRLINFKIPKYRDIWFKTSYLLDQKQSGKTKAIARFDNYKNQALDFVFPKEFNGEVKPLQKKLRQPIAGVLREQGSNSEREMAYALYLAGFKVKDIHMTDLISGREDLKDIDFLAAVGGFSNSDVLGSAKGWAGSFKYNEKAKNALDNFFAKEDTLSLGVCNGCQLFVELGILNPEDKEKPQMLHNDSHKFECQFTSVKIQQNNTIMLSTLVGSKLGIWAAHGEGKFAFPYDEDHYQIPAKYGYDSYPANPNGSDYNAAMLASQDGRHLAMMPHLERSTFPWNWAYYPTDRKDDKVSPWLLAFENAFNWLIKK